MISEIESRYALKEEADVKLYWSNQKSKNQQLGILKGTTDSMSQKSENYHQWFDKQAIGTNSNSAFIDLVDKTISQFKSDKVLSMKNPSLNPILTYKAILAKGESLSKDQELKVKNLVLEKFSIKIQEFYHFFRENELGKDPAFVNLLVDVYVNTYSVESVNPT